MTDNNHIHFQEDGSPFSDKFDDIYFDTESGYLQSQRVFIEGNQIREKLLTSQSRLTIAETGFGTGLNFLLTLRLYHELQSTETLPELHFITTEKYPLNGTQLQKSLACLPHLSQFATQLLAQYPETLTGNTELLFCQGKVTLTLLIGDATASLASLSCSNKGMIDAWYLDGFSPAKNPHMWREELFKELGRLSIANASVATFTVAGNVRRGLTNNGFRVQRINYGGKKKEILTGKFQHSARFGKGYQLRPLRSKPQHVSIVGGGIASACLAYKLVHKGIHVTLYCKDKQLAQGASNNPIGALYPLIHQKADELSQFYQHALANARSFYQALISQGASFSHDWCGLLELSFNDKLQKRQQGISDSAIWPNSLIRSVDAKEASQLSGVTLSDGGLYIPDAGWVAPHELTTAIIDLLQPTGLLKVKYNVTVEAIKQLINKKWQLQTNKGQLMASNLVMAAGAETIKIAPISQLPLQPVKGQITALTTNKQSKSLSTVICHKGYLTPESNGIHCIGATFEKDKFDTTTEDQADQYNLRMLKESMGNQLGWQSSDIIDSKARVRCMTPDHLPISGPMAKVSQHTEIYSHLSKDKNWRYQTPAPYMQNLYVLTGLGARGICSAPLLAEILTADICGTPYPVNNEMVFSVSTNRFIIRDIIKRKVAL
ncbi:bifunctional tRNA (5-methylaminomethyl-2-thiouridine)(34)-methyltransferase MnmD/FAD-dependent 5-carboxymethylaminomethyl-2-thiouridine(34) oxidoreductase MnmC [Thalassotalea sp. PP2-459]|uniref:bifunctional tRNA (5-methylaminomethyl-2-thiouridine)(34)-methyltransferase MnmD/FAD-dependent 5-carboxymethylaminomethyl-2-thiouridine(34) oxidoreductase MnmC n=1 Tax=Thalassotalea sp. PP2-459 TaxID=1742724 RepID=UPI000A9FE074|nr:bifunctional tRNA (5-methylaminomethyl-2-thiouridine)(34)-methyltransferase MnmD/FAD-dependent 5-carboxymethylaminomethyl-2-thiouridine(34) oxidoreductase MnmC [Thalassotalea sp. PP2-459]